MITVDDIRAYPHQIGDALWRVEAAGIPRRSLAGGVAVCGEAFGAGAIAAAILGDRASAPVRDGLDASVGDDSFVLCASYSGDDEAALACFEEAGRRGAPRAVVCTAGGLAAKAREDSVPVIGVPAGMDDPRAAIVYFVLAALEAAAQAGAGPSVRAELEAAVPALTDLAAIEPDEAGGFDLDELAGDRTPAERVLGELIVGDLAATQRAS
ncbi:MAG: glucose/mannose-6-phosphate isomerase [Thermoleophilaceae bacterium]|nr:glucose/mannose-6-phosphate isomerase [Thermoleophilaceae bacterium]MEA2469560.1 glucose/mannose-6-phosphate isomerase [Thermoleophilaceae bacterium]